MNDDEPNLRFKLVSLLVGHMESETERGGLRPTPYQVRQLFFSRKNIKVALSGEESLNVSVVHKSFRSAPIAVDWELVEEFGGFLEAACVRPENNYTLDLDRTGLDFPLINDTCVFMALAIVYGRSRLYETLTRACHYFSYDILQDHCGALIAYLVSFLCPNDVAALGIAHGLSKSAPSVPFSFSREGERILFEEMRKVVKVCNRTRRAEVLTIANPECVEYVSFFFFYENSKRKTGNDMDVWMEELAVFLQSNNALIRKRASRCFQNVVRYGPFSLCSNSFKAHKLHARLRTASHSFPEEITEIVGNVGRNLYGVSPDGVNWAYCRPLDGSSDLVQSQIAVYLVGSNRCIWSCIRDVIENRAKFKNDILVVVKAYIENGTEFESMEEFVECASRAFKTNSKELIQCIFSHPCLTADSVAPVAQFLLQRTSDTMSIHGLRETICLIERLIGDPTAYIQSVRWNEFDDTFLDEIRNGNAETFVLGIINGSVHPRIRSRTFFENLGPYPHRYASWFVSRGLPHCTKLMFGHLRELGFEEPDPLDTFIEVRDSFVQFTEESFESSSFMIDFMEEELESFLMVYEERVPVRALDTKISRAGGLLFLGEKDQLRYALWRHRFVTSEHDVEKELFRKRFWYFTFERCVDSGNLRTAAELIARFKELIQISSTEILLTILTISYVDLERTLKEIEAHVPRWREECEPHLRSVVFAAFNELVHRDVDLTFAGLLSFVGPTFDLSHCLEDDEFLLPHHFRGNLWNLFDGTHGNRHMNFNLVKHFFENHSLRAMFDARWSTDVLRICLGEANIHCAEWALETPELSNCADVNCIVSFFRARFHWLNPERYGTVLKSLIKNLDMDDIRVSKPVFDACPNWETPPKILANQIKSVRTLVRIRNANLAKNNVVKALEDRAEDLAKKKKRKR